jgi:hypothetical protein
VGACSVCLHVSHLNEHVQGLIAPLAASASLFGVYIILTYFPNISLQTFFDGYFFLVGAVSVSSAASAILRV